MSVTAGTDTATINLLEGTNGGAKSVVDSVNIKAGNDIDVTVSGDDITISHETISTTFIPDGAPGTVTATEVDFGGEIPLVSLAEVDNGHVTKLEFKKYKLPTLPEFPDYDIKTQASTTNAKVVLTIDNSVDSTVTISGSDNVTVTSDDNGNVTIVSTDEKTTLSGHYTPTANESSELNTTGATSKGGLTAGESEVITGFKIERDEKGHVVGVVAEKGTLPEGLKIDDVEIGNGKVSLQIAGVEDTSFTLNQTGNATFNIPSASADKYGVIKTGYQTSDKNYAVNLDTNGNAYVSVDWNDTKCTSLNITANEASVPETDTVDVISKQNLSASGSGTSLSGTIESVSVPTKKYVDNAIDAAVENGIKDLGSVLEFKGSVNSAADVPTASDTTKGDVYLVSTAFDNYEIGDLLICNGTQWIAVNANWTATDGNAQLEWGQTTTLATIGGVNIDATLPSNPNTNYYHTRKYDTGLQISEGNGVEDMYVPEAGNEYGVIKTGYQTSGKNYAVQLDENGRAYVSVDWKNDDTTYSAGTGLKLDGTTFNHSNSITAGTAQGGSGTLEHGGTFTVPTVTYDAQGHITSTGTTTYTLPTDNNTTYTFENGSAGSFDVTPLNGAKQNVTVDAEHEVIDSYSRTTSNVVAKTDTIVGAIENLDAAWDWEILS